MELFAIIRLNRERGELIARQCTVCVHADVKKINKQLVEGVTLERLSKTYKLTIAAIQRHQKNHIPVQLAKAHEAKETASADNLMGRITSLNDKAEDVYTKALKAKNYNAAIGAVRELRGILELYAKITGELQAQTVTNIIVMPEWVTLRNSILHALEQYPEARKAVIEAVGRREH